MVSLTGSDSPASDPASFGGPDPVPHASGSETPFPRRRDLRNSDKDYSPDDPATNPAAETGQDVPQVAEKDYGKAGRNLPAAIGIGLLIGGVVLA